MARISKNQLIKLQKKYKTDESIGKLYGITRQAVHQLRTRYGIVPVPDKHEERNAEIAGLYQGNISGAKLSRKYDLSISQIYRILSSAGSLPRTTRRPRTRSRARNGSARARRNSAWVWFTP